MRTGLFVGRKVFRSSATSEEESPVLLPVIMYHSVWDTSPSEYVVTPEQLDSDLNGSGTMAIPRSQQRNLSDTHGQGTLPDKPVLITFDDGHYNNLSDALPVFEKYDMCLLSLL